MTTLFNPAFLGNVIRQSKEKVAQAKKTAQALLQASITKAPEMSKTPFLGETQLVARKKEPLLEFKPEEFK